MQDFRMETFLAVCRVMNYTRAAEQLHLTQPAVTQQIHFLEREYGVPLFRCQGRQVQLTEAGALLRRAALTMQDDERHLRDRMRRAGSARASYRFGATLTVAEFLLPGNLARLLAARPDSRVEMQVGNTRELLEKLDTGTLDFAIVEGDFSRTEYDSLPFRTEAYTAAAAPALAARLQGRALAALQSETLIVRERGSGTREILETCLAGRGLELDGFANAVELGSIGAIKELTKAGLGVTFLYRAAIRREEAEGSLCPVALADFALSHEILFIFRKNSIFRSDYEGLCRTLCGADGGAANG